MAGKSKRWQLDDGRVFGLASPSLLAFVTDTRSCLTHESSTSLKAARVFYYTLYMSVDDIGHTKCRRNRCDCEHKKKHKHVE